MSDQSNTSSSTTEDEVRAILALSATQPGINEMVALIKMTYDFSQINEIYADINSFGRTSHSTNITEQRR